VVSFALSLSLFLFSLFVFHYNFPSKLFIAMADISILIQHTTGGFIHILLLLYDIVVIVFLFARPKEKIHKNV